MTKTKTKAPADTPKNKPAVYLGKDESVADAMARETLAPALRHGLMTQTFSEPITAGLPKDEQPDLAHHVWEMRAKAAQMGGGDLTTAREMLAAQAFTLDGIFTEMARRSALNMGQYIDASERYMRMALKAQAGSRAAIEALAKLHQPREQTVRHVHVNEGGQAVIADEFHHHGGSGENGKSFKQPHAPANGTAGLGPALPSPDPIGATVPLPSGEWQDAMQDARR